jgi:hypothetical protein
MANNLNIDEFDVIDDFGDSFSNRNNIFHNCKSNYMVENDLANFMSSDSKSSMNIIHINCRSLNKNFNSITNLLSRTNCKFTAIGLSETWLTPINSDTFNIDGYKFVSQSRSHKIGGGVGLYIDNFLFI